MVKKIGERSRGNKKANIEFNKFIDENLAQEYHADEHRQAMRAYYARHGLYYEEYEGRNNPSQPSETWTAVPVIRPQVNKHKYKRIQELITITLTTTILTAMILGVAKIINTLW